MVKHLSIVLLLMLLSLTPFSQKQNPLKMVELPDSARAILMMYLKENEKLSIDEIGGIYVFNLQNPKDLKYKDGVYTFRLMGPHYHRRIFIVNGPEIKIFDSQYIDDLLKEFYSFIKQSTLPVKKKIEYLKAISNFLEEEYNTENS